MCLGRCVHVLGAGLIQSHLAGQLLQFGLADWRGLHLYLGTLAYLISQ